MSAITIRQVRQHWPEVEKRLGVERELIITRDSTPVAKLSAVSPPPAIRRKRFTAESHTRLMKELWGRNPPRFDSSKWLEKARRDRFPGSR